MFVVSAARALSLPGHVFVVHGDVRQLSADAVLYPTRNLGNRKWFPSGKPPGCLPIPRTAFTPDERVIRVKGTDAGAPCIYLSHCDGRFAPRDACGTADGSPEVRWFLEAAEQFLHAARAELAASGAPPRCARATHLLAMPVVGTGTGGARGSSGYMIEELLRLLHSYVGEHAVDVALVVKSTRMFSAAQAYRRQQQRQVQWEATLGPRLCAAAAELAALASKEQLGLFLGAGASVGAGLPRWQALLTALAERDDVPLSAEEVGQLATLSFEDQASVLSARLAASSDGGDGDGDGGGGGGDADGEQRLQALVVDTLSASLYSLTHGLLAGLPVAAVVTTNYDELFEAAWRGAQADFNVLPYEVHEADRFILKLHGDVRRPQDIVLTRAQMHDNRETRRALSGIVQSMLITKHLLFVGFSLQDPNFSELAGAVRRALRPVEGGEAGGADVAADTSFGTLLTLHDRPFLAELWPDIDCLPMEREGDGVGGGRGDGISDAECARLLEIFVDKVSLDASTCTAHLLDAKFDGVFSAEEEALKGKLLDFRARLAERPRARDSDGFAVVEEALRRLGSREMPTARREWEEEA